MTVADFYWIHGRSVAEIPSQDELAARLSRIGRAEGDESLTPVSMLIPSLLFDDATMRRIRAATPNPPVSGPPSFDK